MKAKLNLCLDENVVKRAKQFAKSNNTSVSKVVEDYLLWLAADGNHEANKISPLVQSLMGVLDLPAGFDHKAARAEYLQAKYS